MSDLGRARTNVALVSLVVGTAIFASKIVAWQLTGSSAVMSDAFESVVNVVAAAFALFSVRVAAAPPDRNHPYGHGKIEFVSAAFEGGMIAFAAVAIGIAAVDALVRGPDLRQLDLGLGITAAAGVANLVLGAWLVRRGRALRSKAIEADGKHVLSDVWTTLGVLAGLGAVRVTGLAWLDPVTALGVALLLARAGVLLVREAGGALLDEEDPALTALLQDAFEAAAIPGVIHAHNVRTIRMGSEVHIDAHAHVPRFWTVREAHEATDALENALLAKAGLSGELALHLDPCNAALCSACDLPDCPVREEPFVARRRDSDWHAADRPDN